MLAIFYKHGVQLVHVSFKKEGGGGGTVFARDFQGRRKDMEMVDKEGIVVRLMSRSTVGQ